MAISFLKLLNNMLAEAEEEDGATDPLLDSEDEGLAMGAIRNGMNLRKKDCGSFWDDFITICGDANALSELLEIPREKITGWAGKIRDMIDKVKKTDDQTDGESKKEMIPTGNEPPASPSERPGDSSMGNAYNPMPS